MTKILILGAGYVGLAHTLLFTRHPDHHVVVADIDERKISAIQAGISPLDDKEISQALAKQPTNLTACLTNQVSYRDFDVIFLCLPTNYDEAKNRFDTTILDGVLELILGQERLGIPVVIKSTLPIGYTQSMIDRYQASNLIFSPEFLREGQALKNLLSPSRLVFGSSRKELTDVIQLYFSVIEDQSAPVLVMSPSEAESVKLFANTYLAMRVAFFNELDSFAEVNQLSSSAIIKGVGLDERIGRFYNNPSFGYGGYCLPKDSKQLRSNFEGLSADLIGAIVTSNQRRKDFIAKQLLEKRGKTIGIYRLSMKQASDNSRESAILDIMTKLQAAGRDLLVYEPRVFPTLSDDKIEFVTDLNLFKERADLILANRWHDELADVADKVYTRDIFQTD